ncbi:MAG: glucose-6-phosphate isomerase [Elioraea sp.]|nr:glucose-6-phosphate isomerase [Elioraea sp.]
MPDSAPPHLDSREEAWARLATRAADPAARSVRGKLGHDPNRFGRLSACGAGLVLDLSRTALDEALLADLLALAAEADLLGALKRQMRGAMVNATERRAALHTALRAPDGAGIRAETAEGWQDASALVEAERSRLRAFVLGVHDGTIATASGVPFASVLNLGIGGSDLGPAMATEALAALPPRLAARFVGNVDGHGLAAALAGLDAARTLVLVASKSFTTQETMANARVVRAWLAAALGEEGAARHLAALTANPAAAEAFGIDRERIFAFGAWVGGRYSLWSTIGASIALARGWDAFAGLLAGAHAMDCHAVTAPPRRNLPLLLALTHTWHATFCGHRAYACLPYDSRLARLPAWLQQLEMESNGKRVDEAGRPVPYPTAPVVFGEPGTNAQHSFLQLLHQGTDIVPADIVLVARPDHGFSENHRILLANALAQGAALALGRSEAEARAAAEAAGEDAGLAPHRSFPGDRPSIFLHLPRLDPFHLGALLALYEHKVALQAALWRIDAFDQWGVELGKRLAGPLERALATGDTAGLDPASAGAVRLLARFG